MRRWLTPEAATGDYACRRFLIPVELLGHVTGALEQLTHATNFESFGTMTPQEAAELMIAVLDSYTTEDGDCSTMAEIGVPHWRTMPPYPDTGDVVLCDGSAYLKSDYPDYWQQIVNTGHQTYWEISATQFVVPDMVDRFVRGSLVTPGNWEGENEHTITIAELPAHTHGEQDPGTVQAQSGVGAFALSDPGLPSQTGSTGGGVPMPILPEHIQLYPYIRLRGGVEVPATPTVNRAGEIVPYYGETPEYSLVCDGATYLKATYPLLWAQLELELVASVKVFEVDSTQFKVPDFRGRALVGYGQGAGLTNRNNPVLDIGAESVSLTGNQMPAHNHTYTSPATGASTYQGGTNRTAPSQALATPTSTNGQGDPHENMQPSRAVRFAIRYA